MASNIALQGNVDRSDVGIDLVPIVPADGAELPTHARAIRCKPTGSAGSVRFIALSGQERTTDIGAGEVLQVSVIKVFQTGTTATGLEAYL